jgi:hypothetical protein
MPVEEREDFLDDDPEIPGQKIALLSFISPEKVLQDKEKFFFEHFLQDYDFQWKTKNLETFLAGQIASINKKLEENSDELEKKNMSSEAELLRNMRLDVETLVTGFQKYVKQNMKEITQSKIKESYDDFMYRKQADLEDKFFAKNDFKTTIRGVKIRGVYGSTEEAQVRARKLMRLDGKFDIFAAQVGKWTPWDPSAHQIPDQEYANEQLNELMKKYKQNEDATDEFYRNNNLKRPDKQLIGDKDTASNASGDMFSSVGDLALSRKMEMKISAANENEFVEMPKSD